MKSAKLQKITYGILLAVVLLFPIFFLPITSEFYDFNKQSLLIIAGLASLFLWTLGFVLDKQVRITRSPLGLPLLGVLASFALSVFLKSPNKFDAFLEPGQAGTIISLVIIFFTGVNSIHSKKQLDGLITSFVFSLTLLGAVTTLWSTGLMESILPASFLKSSLWTPLGNPLGTSIVLTLTIPFVTILLLKNKIEPKSSRTMLLLATLLLNIAGAGILAYRLFFKAPPANRPVFLSQSVSWTIAMETLKSSPLFGTGPSTYLTDFTRFRPLSYNLSDTWSVRFASSTNYYLQLLSTVGLFGLISYIFLVTRVFSMFTRSWKTTPESSLHAITVAASTTALVALVLQLVIPTNIVYLSSTFFLLIITTAAFKQLGSSLVHEANIDIVAASDSGNRSPILPWVALVLAAVIVLPSSYFFIRAYVAETLFQSALNFATANDGKKTYDTLIQAINTFPYRDTYRSVYAQTNLLLANSLAAGKKEITADERKTITSLIQQSIREAKIAVALNPSKVTNIETLATIYKSLIPLAKGADVWAVTSYREAIKIDPINPNLRISLGGIFYGAKNYDEAIKIYQSAVDLKPNLPNAHYNLAIAYKDKGELQKAITSMATVVNLVPKDTADYTKAVAELDDLKKKAGDKTPVSQAPTEPAKTELESPKPLPSPISTPIELPNDLAPETSTAPSPSPKPATQTTPVPTIKLP
jgi:tetratricopeptide (TPR) repeat protein